VQNREVTCNTSESKCEEVSAKPINSQPCNVDVCPCKGNERRVTVNHYVESKFGGIHQNWAIHGECRNFAGVDKTGKHTTGCCLAPGKYKLTCLSHSRFDWSGGYVEIDGKKYCQDIKMNSELTIDLDLCMGKTDCKEVAPAKLEECDNGKGVKVDVSMFVEAKSDSTAADIAWTFGESCEHKGYTGRKTKEPERHDKTCCLPKGHYKLSCQSGFFSWDRSWLEVNGQKTKECLDTDGVATRMFNFCNGLEDCPTFDGKTLTTVGPSISVGDVKIKLDGDLVDDEKSSTSLLAFSASLLVLLML